MPRHTYALIALVVLSAVAPAEWSIAAPPGQPATAAPADLILRLSAGKAAYALYEPVVISYAVVNPTDSEIRSNLRMRYGQGVALTIQREGQEPRTYQSGPAICTVPASDVVFEPHSVDTGEVVTFYNDRAGELAFPAPGRYRLVASAQVWSQPRVLVQSAPVWVEVREPADFEARAIEALGSREDLVRLFRGGVKEYCRGEKSIQACSDRLRSFLRRYPESAYAPALTYYFGLAVASAAVPVGPEDEPATEIFNGFLRRWPEHPLEADVTAALIEELHRGSRREESFEWLHRFEQKFPERSSQVHELRSEIE